MSKKKEVSIVVRSSAAEYLTFVATSGKDGVEAVYADENIWLTQKMLGLLYDSGHTRHQIPLKEGLNYSQFQ